MEKKMIAWISIAASVLLLGGVVAWGYVQTQQTDKTLPCQSVSGSCLATQMVATMQVVDASTGQPIDAAKPLGFAFDLPGPTMFSIGPQPLSADTILINAQSCNGGYEWNPNSPGNAYFGVNKPGGCDPNTANCQSPGYWDWYARGSAGCTQGSTTNPTQMSVCSSAVASPPAKCNTPNYSYTGCPAGWSVNSYAPSGCDPISPPCSDASRSGPGAYWDSMLGRCTAPIVPSTGSAGGACDSGSGLIPGQPGFYHLRVKISIGVTESFLARDVNLTVGGSTSSSDPTLAPQLTKVTWPVTSGNGTTQPVQFTWCNVPASALAGSTVNFAVSATSVDLQNHQVSSSDTSSFALNLPGGSLSVHITALPQSIAGVGYDGSGNANPWSVQLQPRRL